MLLGAFRPPKPDKVFPGAENAASACSTLKATQYSHSHRRGKQLKGWRAKKLNLIGTINPKFKDLAQTWDGIYP
jgi:hypothetical protein